MTRACSALYLLGCRREVDTLMLGRGAQDHDSVVTMGELEELLDSHWAAWKPAQ